MSPTPLIELQRRLAEAGRIRMGEKTERGAPKRLDTWRITSPSEELVRQAAGLYGGEPKPWESPSGKQFEVVTTTAELPILVMPGYSLRQTYELRTSPTVVERRCDGIEQENGEPCACNAEGFAGDPCKLITRLTVALPELTTMLGWRLETKGENAARELLASMDLVQGVAQGRPFVPAKLRIVERRGAVDGQAVRYVVPVIDMTIGFGALAELSAGGAPSSSPALPPGYTPIEAPKGNGVSLEEGLAQAENQTYTRGPRSAAPIPAVDDVPFGEDAVPVPGDEPAAPPTNEENLAALNALVGQLREAGAISTRQVWVAVARMRSVKVDEMIELLEGEYEGDLHWTPLRDSLDEREAAELRKRLGRLWAESREGATA